MSVNATIQAPGNKDGEAWADSWIGSWNKILSAWIFALPGAALLGAGGYTVLFWFP